MTLPTRRAFRGLWVPERLVRDSRLTCLDRLLAVVVDTFAGMPTPSHSQLAGELGVPEVVVPGSLRRLIASGWLEDLGDGNLAFTTPDAAPRVVKPPKTLATAPKGLLGASPDVEKARELARLFFRTQIANWPRMVKPPSAAQIEASAKTLLQIERLDGYAWEEIRKAVMWATKDGFWSRNVLSPATLRVKGRNGATKFANIFAACSPEDAATPAGGPALDVSPVVAQFRKMTSVDPTPQQGLQLRRDLLDLWAAFPGEPSRAWIVPATGPGGEPNRNAAKSVKACCGRVENLPGLYAKFLDSDYKWATTVSFNSLLSPGTVYQKFKAHLSERWGVDLRTGALRR